MATKRVALVSCVKSKRGLATHARDLYTSPLFVGMRRYAETNADEWFILSAEHGVLRPSQVVSPYEKTLNKMGKAERAKWSSRVEQQLREVLQPGSCVVLLAGERYREGILPFLKRHGFDVEIPMAGLKMGHQLSWLKNWFESQARAFAANCSNGACSATTREPVDYLNPSRRGEVAILDHLD